MSGQLLGTSYRTLWGDPLGAFEECRPEENKVMISHKQNFVCWPSVGPQDIKHTYIHESARQDTMYHNSLADRTFVPKGNYSQTGLHVYACQMLCWMQYL